MMKQSRRSVGSKHYIEFGQFVRKPCFFCDKPKVFSMITAKPRVLVCTRQICRVWKLRVRIYTLYIEHGRIRQFKQIKVSYGPQNEQTITNVFLRGTSSIQPFVVDVPMCHDYYILIHGHQRGYQDGCQHMPVRMRLLQYF